MVIVPGHGKNIVTETSCCATGRRAAGIAVIAAVVINLICIDPADAGLWDDPKNLEVLPVDISPDELRETMRSFAGATGSRCDGCHVGDDPNDLRTFDFAADDKPQKQTARDMIRLVRDINHYLDDRPGSGESRIAVTCRTCHRGNRKPLMIENVVLDTLNADGIAAAERHFTELRDLYFGSDTYDFSHRPLLSLGEQLGAAGRIDAALAMLDLNLGYYPDSVFTLILKGRLLADDGRYDDAVAAFARAVELEPGNDFARQLLERATEAARR